MINHKSKTFINSQSFGGVILFISAFLAVLLVNSQFITLYQNLFSISLPIHLPFSLPSLEMNLKMWIDDGLMSIFFLLVGLELKREILIGELSSKIKMIVPFCAAFGGVVMPVLIYCLVNFGETKNLPGAAIPAATDIAFAVGVLSLFGDKISHRLKMFLVALAIVDDLIAILIIAFFYSHNIDLIYLGFAFLAILLLWLFNRINIISLAPYILVAPFLWFFIFKSGIHPTISGIILAFFIPLINKIKNKDVNLNQQSRSSSRVLPHSPAKILENFLQSPVTYIILPIFAFANSGLVFDNFSLEIFFDKVFLGIVLGLFLGKQIGIVLVVYLLEKFKISNFLQDCNWLEFYGVAILAGIGFTMSLFIMNLAFEDPDMIDKVRFGVVFGSLISGIFGFIILKIATSSK